jgi:regulatory protein
MGEDGASRVAMSAGADGDTSPGLEAVASLHEEIRSRALKLLTTREHSRLELSRKLQRRGYDGEAVGAVLDALEADALLSEERLISAYVAERLGKGFGPVRILFELREKGLSDEQIHPYLARDDESLMQCLAQAYRKRYGDQPLAGVKDQSKRSRFLEYRGFPPRLIAHFFRAGPIDE